MGAGNVGYLVFVVFLIVLTVTLSVRDPSWEEAWARQILGLFLLIAISVVFFAVNAILAVAALIRGRSAAKPLIGCALPIIVAVILWAFPSLLGP